MGYEIVMGQRTIGTLGQDNKMHYNQDMIKTAVTEMIAGQSGGSGSFNTTARVVYRWDKSRIVNNDAVYNLWKSNPIMQNRVSQLNALVFGRGLKWIYEPSIQEVIDRFWRINRIRNKLNAIGTDIQLYGEAFIGLFPQESGDVLMSVYESNQVEIDFSPGDVHNINKYIVTYKNEETNKDEQFDMMPIEKYLNEIEFATPLKMGGGVKSVVRKVRKSLGLTGQTKVKGKGIMAHIKFNSASSEIFGTSDFKQVFSVISAYMNFVNDRLTIHQIYGSPAYDITIDTDDPTVIINRINELAGFEIGSNPVHNKQEEWKPLEFNGGGIPANGDEHVLRGLLCAGTGFPEYLLFNQSEINDSNNTFALTKIAEDRQDAFCDLFTDIHKCVVAIFGGDPTLIDNGQIVFAEINTMSEKAKAETYVLKVGAKICSRRTAALNMGHNWDIEREQILVEEEMMGELLSNSDNAGRIGGRFSSRINNQEEDRDDGEETVNDTANNITTPIMASKNRGNTSGG